MVLNTYGGVAQNCWYNLPKHYLNCSLDSFVVVPNHIHGIIMINSEKIVGNGLKPFPTHDLSEIIRGFKIFSSRRINEGMIGDKKFHWQKSFYDHVIRNDRSLDNLRQYIINHPLKWELDIENGRDEANRLQEKTCKEYYKKIIEG
jgi:REP element-mobilizing transposase RayT